MTKPQLLTVYTDSYFGNPQLDLLKKGIKTKFKIVCDETPEYDSVSDISETVAKANAIDPNLLKTPTA